MLLFPIMHRTVNIRCCLIVWYDNYLMWYLDKTPMDKMPKVHLLVGT